MLCVNAFGPLFAQWLCAAAQSIVALVCLHFAVQCHPRFLALGLVTFHPDVLLHPDALRQRTQSCMVLSSLAARTMTVNYWRPELEPSDGVGSCKQ